MVWKLIHLPYPEDLETKSILKQLPAAHAALAELKGIVQSIPNQIILLNALGIQEAKDSSSIENIITTHDDLYKANLDFEVSISPNVKEVQNYVAAMKRGFELVESQGLLTNQTLLKIQETLEGNNAGFRKLPGTALKNAQTGAVIYLPPQDPAEIQELMTNLEQFINDPELSDYDPLVKMAIMHYQFESIHPFYDGNGRTGRILNILYLILTGLQKLPILYLSNHFIQNNGSKSVDYFHKKLGKIMWNKCGMARNEKDLKDAIREISELRNEFWKEVKVPGESNEFNEELAKAGRVADFLELGELFAKDALVREESAGGHFREEYQTKEGEAQRRKEFQFVSAWEYTGEPKDAKLHKENLTYKNIEVKERSYK